MKFELYLDESGDFSKDDQLKDHFNPSLVGGVLIPSGSVSKKDAQSMIFAASNKLNTHCMNENADTIVNLIREIDNKGLEIVIFENSEKLKIIDSTTTYLNIMAEGIINLLLRLAAQYGSVELNILAAKRFDTATKQGDISLDTYKKLLRERVIVGLARNGLSSKHLPKFNFQLGDANTDHHLMLADAVCNGYLTRKAKKKFTKEQRDYLKELYKKAYISSLAPKLVKRIDSLLIQNRIDDAIFTLLFECTQDHAEAASLLNELVKVRLTQLTASEVDAYLSRVSLEYGHLINIQREYPLAKKIGEMAQNVFIPMLHEESILYSKVFDLDIILYLYTIYTHEGNIIANKQDELFNQKINEIEDLFVRLNYFIMYKNRRAVHLMNYLEYEKVVTDLSSVINACDELTNLLEMIEQFNKGPTMKFNQLGKLHGTRGQAYARLITENPDYLTLAINDFDKAIQHFEKDEDFDRQYVYKANAYLNANDIENSLLQLLKCEDIEILTEETIMEACNIWAKNSKNSIFKINAFISILAKSNHEKFNSETLTNLLNRSSLNIDKVVKELKKDLTYPLPLIYWNLAIAAKTTAKKKNVKDYIDKALQLLEEIPMGAQMLQLLRLGVLTWEYEYLIEQEKLQPIKQKILQDNIDKTIALLSEKAQLELIEKLKLNTILDEVKGQENRSQVIEIVKLI